MSSLRPSAGPHQTIQAIGIGVKTKDIDRNETLLDASMRASGMIGNVLRNIVVVCLGLAAMLRLAGPFVRADEPRLNQLQVIGSHNSYHVAP